MVASHSEIIKKYGIHAKKSLGQNFLINDGILEKIATATKVKDKNIIEVGPGYGALTERLLDIHPCSLTLVELDADMVHILESRIQDGDLTLGESDFQILKQDVLTYNPVFEEYSVIANIPYYITSPILFHFLYEVENRPNQMVILLQKDVGDKIRKVAGNKSSVLSLFIDMACENVEEICRVAAGNFIPAPKVESAVLRFDIRADFDVVEAKKILEYIKIGFSERRKKLLSNLSKGLGISKDRLLEVFIAKGLSENVRAEELSPDDWKNLVKTIGQIT